jgi:hypothetical protein
LQSQNHRFHIIRNINKYTIEEFKTRLSHESWGNIFGSNGNMDVDCLFRSFLDNYLRIFYTSFPPQKVTERSIKNSWITPGITISCGRKKCFYLLPRDSDDVNLKNDYKQCCKTLASVIKEARMYMCNNQIINSTNKMKTTWNIIKTETNRLKGPTTLTINSYQNSPEAFNKYFLSVTKITLVITNKVTTLKKIQNITCQNYIINLFPA